MINSFNIIRIKVRIHNEVLLICDTKHEDKMKLLIVLALLGAAFATPSDEVEPVVLGEAPAPSLEVEPVVLDEVQVPEFVDFGIAYVPESVAAEVGLDRSVDEPTPVHFVNENGDIESVVYETPVEAPVDLSAIAPGELESVRVADLPDFAHEAFVYDVKVETPVFVDAPESNPNEYVKHYDDPTWR